MYDLRLNSYVYIDNISVYDKSKFVGCLKEEWFDENGQILPQHVQPVRLGDGVNTVNEIIDERDV